MSRPFVLLTLAMWPAAVLAQEKSGQSVVEIRFADGSTVRRAEVLQESLELATKYGKLTIPSGDIRRIELGVHLPPAVEARVQEALRQLGSEAYGQREQASKDLLKVGAPVYPLLARAAKSGDPEVARRSQELMERLRHQLTPEQLRIKIDDLVQTAEFTATGRIVQTSIKVRTPYFGIQDLQTVDLRALHWRGGSGESELLVDAAKFGSARDQWLDTGIAASGGRLLIVAAGQVDLWPQGPGQYLSTPRGYGNGAVHTGTPGALVGRINGKVFLIGERFDAAPPDEGTLFLHIIPSPWNNASTGSYKVKITSQAD